MMMKSPSLRVMKWICGSSIIGLVLYRYVYHTFIFPSSSQSSSPSYSSYSSTLSSSLSILINGNEISAATEVNIPYGFNINNTDNHGNSSSNEIIDLSQHGEIGTISTDIETIHLRGLSHRGVWIILFNANHSQVLFVKRSKQIIICPNAWNIVGEHTKAGESYQATILRGLREELNVLESDLTMLRPVGDLELFQLYHEKLHRTNKQWTQTYAGTLASDELNLDSKEASLYIWVNSNDAIHWITSCDYLPSTGSCEPRTCTDSSNITVTCKRTGVKTSYLNYGQLVASKIAAAITLLNE